MPSMPQTACPSALSRFAKWKPIKPADPVTRQRTALSLSSRDRSPAHPAAFIPTSAAPVKLSLRDHKPLCLLSKYPTLTGLPGIRKVRADFASAPDAAAAEVHMKVRNSLKSLRSRHRDNRIVRR